MHSKNVNKGIHLSVIVVVLCVFWGPSHGTPLGRSRRCASSEAFHKETRQCYTIGTQGPCGDLMVFKRDEMRTRSASDNSFWAAYEDDEDDFDDEILPASRSLGDALIFPDSQARNNYSSRGSQSGNGIVGKNYVDMMRVGRCECAFVFGPKCSARPLVLWKATRKCYPLYSQGPCKMDEWLVHGRDGLPSCEANPCKDSITFHNNVVRSKEEYLAEFIFPHNGSCYQTFTRAFCPPGQEALFPDPRAKDARCFPVDDGVCPTDRIIGASAPIGCKNGTTMSHDGECTEIVEYK